MIKLRRRFHLNDISEIIVGSVLLAFPVATTEEVWNLGAELSLFSAIIIVVSSLAFIAWFAYHTYYLSYGGTLERFDSPDFHHLYRYAPGRGAHTSDIQKISSDFRTDDRYEQDDHCRFACQFLRKNSRFLALRNQHVK